MSCERVIGLGCRYVTSYEHPGKQIRRLTELGKSYAFGKRGETLLIDVNFGFVAWRSSINSIPECLLCRLTFDANDIFALPEVTCPYRFVLPTVTSPTLSISSAHMESEEHSGISHSLLFSRVILLINQMNKI